MGNFFCSPYRRITFLYVFQLFFDGLGMNLLFYDALRAFFISYEVDPTRRAVCSVHFSILEVSNEWTAVPLTSPEET